MTDDVIKNFKNRKISNRLLNALDLSNEIESSKKGSKIHIKKENRGKFTDYCGGKVTEECILRGKNSPDPKIRKRATFAKNARAWKHLDGGMFKRQWEAIFPKSWPVWQSPGFTGGRFGGAGAGGRFELEEKKPMNFNEAFDYAVANNLKTFTFGGKEFNTRYEDNPIREFNNRFIGSGRTEEEVKALLGYPTEYGPLGGPLSLIPWDHETYKPELIVPDKSFDANFKRYTFLPGLDKARFILPSFMKKFRYIVPLYLQNWK